MCASGRRLGGLGAALLCLAGCWTTQPSLKPPPVPPEWLLPPADDPRFSEPPSYPDRVLNEGLQKKDSSRDMGLPEGGLRNPATNRFGAGGMGGPGM